MTSGWSGPQTPLATPCETITRTPRNGFQAGRRATIGLDTVRRLCLKVLGLIGGMSWESTAVYYRRLNEIVHERLGGLHSAKIVLYSVDFHEIEEGMRAGRWDDVGAALGGAARALEAAGAEIVVMTTNTLHKVAPAVEAAVRIPLLHIVDPTAEAIGRARFAKVGLLGTRFTMEQEFYRERLRRHGLEVIVPGDADREIVHRVIFDELCLGKVLPASRTEYRRVMAGLADEGAEALILGCTEIAMLVGPEDASVPLFDTTELHVRAAVGWALAAG